MLKTNQQKEAVFIACMDALAPVNSLDCAPDELKIALQDALQKFSEYPDFQKLKRAIIKGCTADKYAIAIENDLRLCVAGKGTILTLCAINAALADALQLVQRAN